MKNNAYTILLKTMILWFGICMLAITNGVLRESLLIPIFGLSIGFMLSGLLLSFIIFGVAYIFTPWLGASQRKQYFFIGATWTFVTLIFEFSLGRLVQGKSWQDIFQAYTFADGNIWPVVLVVCLFSPYLAAKARGLV